MEYDTKTVRAWAVSVGLVDPGKRGRLSKKVFELYEKARHPDMEEHSTATLDELARVTAGLTGMSEEESYAAVGAAPIEGQETHGYRFDRG